EVGLKEYLSRVESLYEHGRKSSEEGINKAKYLKLQKKESDIGDGFIERDLRDSQYIARQAKKILYDITRTVVSTTGSITGRLREDWGLVNIMKEINLPKYRALGMTEMEERKFGQQVEVIKDWSKRDDHRHHAMDALVIAFTKHNHIQYLNYLNARKNEKHELHRNIIAIETKETEIKIGDKGEKKRVFKLPIPNFREQARQHLQSVLVSHKTKNKIVTRNKNRIKSKKGEINKIELTPRGQLHKETIYGKYRYYENKEVKVDGKLEKPTINCISNPQFKMLLLDRLEKHNNDSKKAFTGKNSLSKNPIYLNEEKTETLPEKVTVSILVDDYSIRKEIVGSNPTSKQFVPDYKSIEKVLDTRVRYLLKKRLDDYGGNPQLAFSDLDKNPIWFNEEKQISIKRVKISAVKNAVPLHFKKDHKGNFILDEQGQKIPVDFVSQGNNHHVAIYRDEKGSLQERVVSFFDAVQLTNAGEPVVDKYYRYHEGWRFLFSLKQNEMFIFPDKKGEFNPKEVDLMDPRNKEKISPNLFRVQKIASKDYLFTSHLETKAIDGTF